MGGNWVCIRCKTENEQHSGHDRRCKLCGCLNVPLKDGGYIVLECPRCGSVFVYKSTVSYIYHCSSCEHIWWAENADICKLADVRTSIDHSMLVEPLYNGRVFKFMFSPELSILLSYDDYFSLIMYMMGKFSNLKAKIKIEFED